MSSLPEQDLMNNKHKGNLAIASAIKHFVSVGYTVSLPLSGTAKYDLVVEREALEIAGQTTINVGRESKWSKWEQYHIPGTGGDCSATEESVDENSSNSAKSFGMATPSQALTGEGVET
jgi:hypothetical protein